MAEPKDLTFYFENKEYKVFLKPFITGKLKMELIEIINKAPKSKVDVFQQKYLKEITEINKVRMIENPDISVEELGSSTISELVSKGVMTYDDIINLQKPEDENYEKEFLEYIYTFISKVIDYDKLKDENIKSKIEDPSNLEFWENQDLESFQKVIEFFRKKIGR